MRCKRRVRALAAGGNKPGQPRLAHRLLNARGMNPKSKCSVVALAAPIALLCAACGDASQSPGGVGGAGATTGTGGTGAGGSGAGAGSSPFQCVGSGAVGDTIPIPAGEFVMGCNSAVDDECESDETPMHTVDLSAYEIDRNEVTQDQYASCVNAGSCAPPKCEWDCAATTLPASCVTQDDAIDYCTWVGKRLPTEAEWEKAARGSDGRKFPWGNQPADCTLVNMVDCVGSSTPVGSYPNGASPYGALDMGGNMVEIVADFYDESYYSVSPSVDPKGPATGSRFVGRGGGWRSTAFWQRTSVRDWYDPPDAGISFGFRCAR